MREWILEQCSIRKSKGSKDKAQRSVLKQFCRNIQLKCAFLLAYGKPVLIVTNANIRINEV